jgi:hypothetical protein
LLEEGNPLEAGVVAGLEGAEDADERDVRAHEAPEDDVPKEYVNKTRCVFRRGLSSREAISDGSGLSVREDLRAQHRRSDKIACRSIAMSASYNLGATPS